MDSKGNITSSKNIAPAALSEVYQVHQDLLKTIDEMDVKIDEVIKQHEAQFLLAYRNHIKTMKQELTSIKQKAEQQQKKMLSNDRAVYLQKQLILFREQALKLYDKLEEKTQECQHHKSQVKEYQKVKSIIEKENRELLKTNKSLEAQIAIQDNRILEIFKQNNQLKTDLELSKHNLKQLSKGQTLQTYQFTENIQNNLYTPKPNKQIFNMSINSRKQSRVPSLKPNKETQGSNNSTNGKKMSQDLMDHQLKNWFLQCIETIRRQVAQRKVYGYKSQNVNGIANWQEFRMIDKLRLLQMFMQNQKLLVWMYEKIFPSKINEVQSYLKSKVQNVFENREKSKSVNISADDLLLEFPKNEKDPTQTLNNDDLNNDLTLPKVLPSSHKKSMKKKYDIRQRIDIKNGKLNFSAIQHDL